MLSEFKGFSFLIKIKIKTGFKTKKNRLAAVFHKWRWA